MYALNGLGDEEGMLRVGEQIMKAACGRPGRAPEDDYQDYDQQVWDLQAKEVSRARPPDSPLPGECRVSRMR
jgi:hypothetical protein